MIIEEQHDSEADAATDYLREQLRQCSAAFDRQQEMLDRNAEQIATLREQLEKAQSEYICSCGIRVTPHRCPTNNGF